MSPGRAGASRNAHQSGYESAPALPLYDWGACPGEGCTYGDWTARRPVVVYDTWKEKRHRVAKLSRGDKVVALNGVLITFKPGIIRIKRDLPKYQLKRGDTILTYAYRGEGDSAVWFKGRYYYSFDISFTRWPDGSGCSDASCEGSYVDMGKKSCWAEVALKSGQMGWVVDVDSDDFDGICSLVGPRDPPQ